MQSPTRVTVAKRVWASAVLALAVASIASQAASAQTAPSNAPGVVMGRCLVQQATHLRLYMRHYALFEEPGPGVLPAIYIDAAMGVPTNELMLSPPTENFSFAPSGPHSIDCVVLRPASLKRLPYVASSQGFPALNAPSEFVEAIQRVLGGGLDDWLTR